MSAEALRAVVVVPTYNNQRTVRDILERVGRLGLGAIVVNDGSTDGTAAELEAWQRGTSVEGSQIVRHDLNRGKGASLLSGFTTATEAGWTHAVTIDADGQLDPEQIPDLIAAAAVDPRALIIGARDAGRADYPARSRLGRWLSNLVIRLECGARVADSQCGFRAYPLAMLQKVRCRSGHFDFEAEVITRAAWAGYPIVNVPVRCRYFDRAHRVSHFRPAVDSVRGALLHARLLLIAPINRLRLHRRCEPAR